MCCVSGRSGAVGTVWVVYRGVTLERIAAGVYLCQLPRQANTLGADNAFAECMFNSSFLVFKAAKQFG